MRAQIVQEHVVMTQQNVFCPPVQQVYIHLLNGDTIVWVLRTFPSCVVQSFPMSVTWKEFDFAVVESVLLSLLSSH